MSDNVDDWADTFVNQPCTHAFRHTVYGSSDPSRNGTTCQVCGAVLGSEEWPRKPWRRSGDGSGQ